MIAPDTNVVVRYLVKDDRAQTAKATECLRSNQCVVLTTVLLEAAWVLSSSSGYNLPREVVLERLYHFLGLPMVEVEESAKVSQALSWYREGMDFADALHLAGSVDFGGLATFDRKLAATAARLDAIPSVHRL